MYTSITQQGGADMAVTVGVREFRQDLADYIESQRRQALQEWRRVNGATHRLS